MSTNKPLISIIIATFNADKEIKSCLESIIQIQLKSFEVLVVDGCSTDKTMQNIRSLNIPQLKLISEPDNGIYDALNKGIQHSSGKWLYFMGADDRLLPDFSKLSTELKDENTVYYGNSEPLNILLSGPFSNYRLAKHCMNHQSILYPAGVFIKYKYNTKYKVFADYALNLQVWGDNQFIKKYFPYTIVHYNMYGYSAKMKDKLFLRDREKLIRKSLGWGVYLRFLYKKFKTRKHPEILHIGIRE